ncbi:MAG TPA: GNAT family N-acetyltransferase [Bryobacteraceae bacterium]|nr:GNAT family N-acetyltransferase [Bryobacteraceae bacterium]
MTGIEIRALEERADLDAAVGLQNETWGYAPGESVPLQMFIIAAGTGGQVFGAFEGGRMVGFCLAFAGLKPDGRPYLYSHMLAVRPECRDRHIGRALKMEQRREALARGIELVEWTFDPLELKNAYFNIEVLGVVARRYLPDHWGSTSSPLHGSVPTDRLVAEWWLRQPLPPLPDGRGSVLGRISVPEEIGEARRVQAAIRAQFLDSFGRGLAVVGFERGTYLLGKWPSE